MYEEEDDHLPLAFRGVRFRPDIPDKFRDYTMIHMGMRGFGTDSDAMAKQDNEERVNSAFAAAFPGIGYQPPQRQTEPVQVPLVSPTHFQQATAAFQFPAEWRGNSTMPQTTTSPMAQSPGLVTFLPEMQRGLSNGSHQMVRTPSHESFAAAMPRHGSTSSGRSTRMERQGSAASMSSSLSHGPNIWPPPSPGHTDLDGFFGAPLSATTPLGSSHGMPQSRSMSVPFPAEPRGNRRRRDEFTPALSSPSYGMPLVSPSHSIPPAKRNRSDAGLAYGHLNRSPSTITPYPFSLEVPGNVQGMLASTSGSDYQHTLSAGHQQNLAYNQLFQQGLAIQQGSQAVPRLQPPPRKGKGPGQTRVPRQPMSRPGSKDSDTAVQSHQPDAAKKIKVESDTEQAPNTVAATSVAEQVLPKTKTETKHDIEGQAGQDQPYTFDGMGSFLGSFGGQDATGWELDFNADDWPAGSVDGGSFSFDDLLQFPASQPDE